MTNEQEKAKELATLLTAFAEGKQLQFLNDEGYWCDYQATIKDIAEEFLSIESIQIRIKPERKTVALTQQDLIDRELSDKTISVIYNGMVSHILRYSDSKIYFSEKEIRDYEYLTDFKFLDGTPCYKEVESE